MRRDQDRLQDILDAITAIQKYAVLGHDTFENNELVQSWIIRQVEIMGEAARSLSEQIRLDYPQIPWSGMIGTRTIIAHGYFRINPGRIWDIVQNDLDAVKSGVEIILEQLNSGNTPDDTENP